MIATQAQLDMEKRVEELNALDMIKGDEQLV
jgi:hypothetical protein